MIITVEESSNSKTGPVSTTYAPQASCPQSCPLRDAGCYAEGGLVGIHTRQVNRAARAASKRQTTSAAIAAAEARAIDKLSGQRPMRLHVVGDARTTAAARILAAAANRYMAKAGQVVWTYTHAWRTVARRAWDKISVLASTEQLSDAKLAMRQGYAVAVVVAQHPVDGKAWVDGETGLKVIPCPAQTRQAVQCVDCKLCWRDGWLRESGAVIAFESHGYRKRMVAELVQIGKGK